MRAFNGYNGYDGRCIFLLGFEMKSKDEAWPSLLLPAFYLHIHRFLK